MEFFQDDIFPPTRDTSKPAVEAAEWFNGQSPEPSTIDLCPPGMQRLSQAPVEKKTKKYDFNTEVSRDANRFSKERVKTTQDSRQFLDNYFNKMNDGYGEEKEQVLVQDKMEGANADEW